MTRKTEEEKHQEKIAIEFVKDLQEKFAVPIIENIDKFLNNQYEDEIFKKYIRKVLMITISNSILLKSGASRKELKQSYRGLINDYDKIK